MYRVHQVKFVPIILMCFVIIPAAMVYFFNYIKVFGLIDAKYFNMILSNLGLISGVIAVFLTEKCYKNHMTVSKDKKYLIFTNRKWFFICIFIHFLMAILGASMLVTMNLMGY